MLGRASRPVDRSHCRPGLLLVGERGTVEVDSCRFGGIGGAQRAEELLRGLPGAPEVGELHVDDERCPAAHLPSEGLERGARPLGRERDPAVQARPLLPDQLDLDGVRLRLALEEPVEVEARLVCLGGDREHFPRAVHVGNRGDVGNPSCTMDDRDLHREKPGEGLLAEAPPRLAAHHRTGMCRAEGPSHGGVVVGGRAPPRDDRLPELEPVELRVAAQQVLEEPAPPGDHLRVPRRQVVLDVGDRRVVVTAVLGLRAPFRMCLPGAPVLMVVEGGEHLDAAGVRRCEELAEEVLAAVLALVVQRVRRPVVGAVLDVVGVDVDRVDALRLQLRREPPGEGARVGGGSEVVGRIDAHRTKRRIHGGHRRAPADLTTTADGHGDARDEGAETTALPSEGPPHALRMRAACAGRMRYRPQSVCTQLPMRVTGGPKHDERCRSVASRCSPSSDSRHCPVVRERGPRRAARPDRTPFSVPPPARRSVRFRPSPASRGTRTPSRAPASSTSRHVPAAGSRGRPSRATGTGARSGSPDERYGCSGGRACSRSSG